MLFLRCPCLILCGLTSLTFRISLILYTKRFIKKKLLLGNVGNLIAALKILKSIQLQLKRLSTYFVLNIFVPIILLAMTSPMPFALPAHSGERMSLTVTLLLAFTVYLTIIANDMPQSSVQVSSFIKKCGDTFTGVLLTSPSMT